MNCLVISKEDFNKDIIEKQQLFYKLYKEMWTTLKELFIKGELKTAYELIHLKNIYIQI